MLDNPANAKVEKITRAARTNIADLLRFVPADHEAAAAGRQALNETHLSRNSVAEVIIALHKAMRDAPEVAS